MGVDMSASKSEEEARANQKKFELEQKQLREQQIMLEGVKPSASEDVFEGRVEGDKENVDYIQKMYIKKFESEDWYKEPTKNADGSTQFSFPDEKACMDFFGEMAKKEQKFIVIDGATGNVLAYSTGDGQLHKNEGNKLSLDEVRKELEKGQQQSMKPT
jgi:hypothetical protein